VERIHRPFFLGDVRSCHGFKRTVAGPDLCKQPGGKVAAKPGLTESVLSSVKGIWLARDKHFWAF
jgi:hypothetical protein